MRMNRRNRAPRAWIVVLASVLVTLLACSQRHDESTNTPAVDASAAVVQESDNGARLIADGVVRALTVSPALATRFSPNVDGLLRSKDGVTSPGWRGAAIDRAHHVGARLPESAHEPFVAGVGVSEDYRLTLEHLDARHVPIALDEGRAVYRDVYPSTDLTFAASSERLEWAYTLRDESAPSSIDLRVTLPKNLVSTRWMAGALEFLDADGRALLRVPAVVAVDADGVQREATLALDGEKLSVSLDRKGLKFPIVIDPAVETIVWQQRVQVPGARSYHVGAYDSARKKVVVFGGYGSAPLSDTWEFDGLVWALRATAGPSARMRAAMTYDPIRAETILFGGSAGANETWAWNGTAWIQKCTTAPCSTTRPSARSSAAMTFDVPRGKIVLFGGDAFGSYQSDTWTWDGSVWAPSGATGPSARFNHSLTYDSTGSRVLLFGGDNGTTKLNDLWSYNGTSWAPVATSGGPPPARSYSPMVFRSAFGKAVLFGGVGATGSVLSDTWEFTSSTNTWSNYGGAAPTPRYSAVGAYDSARNVAVFFGGEYSASNSETWEFRNTGWARPPNDVGERSGAASAFDSFRNRIVVFSGGIAPPYPNDTWEWTGFNWTRVCTTAPCTSLMPGGRSQAASAYDSTRRRMVLFGGHDGAAMGDTWEYDGTQWFPLCTGSPCNATKPSNRSGSAMAFDSARNRTVLFGGSGGSQETWEWTGAAWIPMCTVSPCNSTLPAARQHAGMAFDSDRNRIVLFGGWLGGVEIGDTWEWNGSTWLQRATTGPSARHFVRLTYDSIRKKTVLFGGRNGGTALGDTWEWNGTSWIQTASSGPNPRFATTFDYDSSRRRVVAFGGSAGVVNYGDTWEYYTRGGACSVGTQCETGYCVDGVCCEQVSCGTCQACDTVGSPGLCATISLGDDPDSCPAATSSCDVTGQCKKKNAQSCSLSTECASGSCANGYCCSTACAGGCDVCNVTPGTCTNLADGVTGIGCGAYLCGGSSGACPTTCAVDLDCATGYFCASGGICQAQRTTGLPCNTSPGGDCSASGCRECVTGLTCKDGYCCNGPCAGNCQTCAKTPGSCTTVTLNDDPDTCTGTNTCSLTGACLKQNGEVCSAASQCASNSCVDGYCCNSACSGGCDECASTPGKCSIVAQGNPGASPSCVGYVCNGSLATCPTVCGNDADCAPSFYCAADATCQPRKSAGATCNIASGGDCRSSGCRVCTSNSCVDGYCCDSPCGGSCNACNGAALGWSGATNGFCATAPLSYPGNPACTSYACDGASSVCATSCTSDAQCGSGYYCNAAGACVGQKTQGAACNLASDCKVSGTCRACATGNCVDGYCCNTACGAQCQACDVGGALGSCVTVTGAVHGSRAACSGSGSCAASCNGVDATSCKYAGASVACGTTSCASSVQTNVGTCNGGGTCNQSTTPCGNYACGTTTCKTSCAIDTDCANTTFYCAGGACLTKKASGDACTSNSACTSGNCVSGICCDTACSTAGYSCSISGSLGKCSKVNGTACTTATECGSGKCVDGVCCDGACTGQCQACNVTGSVGTCSNVIGAPVGGRTACGGTGAGTLCGARCDGTNATACSYPASTTSCSSASCTAGVESTAGTCNGGGSCSFTTKPCGAYTCGASACRSTCSADLECAGSFYCKLGLCAPREILGATCGGASACASGNCVDGVCCNTSSCGTGLRCNIAGSLGSCAKPNGAACTTSTECASSFCVDGVCCDVGCNSQCAACDVTGKVGTCSAVVGAPHGSRSACSGAGAGSECGPVCDGTDMSACHQPGGAKSCSANSCTSSGGTFIEKHTSVCDGAGGCSDEPKTCVGYTCGTTSCKTSCTASTDCATGFYCKTGACVPIEGLGTSCTTALTCTSGFCTDTVCCAVGSCGPGRSCSAGTGTLKGVCVSLNGTACSANAECASGVCADGVCCDSACNGSCEACNKAGSIGKCVPIVGDPLTGHPACTGTSTDSACASRCDGTDGKICKYPGTTSVCGKPSCGGSVEVQVSTCDGAGTCKPASKACAPYVCGPTACLSSCTKNEECGSGNYCKTGACVKVEGLGKVCGGAAECESGFCADGVCCSVASCGEGSSCAGADSTAFGTCLKKKGVACTKADECATGRCVDGFCCDLACSGQCEACDLTGSEGTCTPVVGVPHGADRMACDVLDAKDCAKAQCDGTTRDKCVGFANGGTTSCGMTSCTSDKRFQAIGACDGAGKCAMPEPKPCTPFACDATASTGCKTTCAADDDCAADFKCEAGACIQGAKCSDDRLSSIDKAGASKNCSPYRCGSDGKCATSCATSDDCAPGTVCDTNVKACIVYTVDDTGGDGGCGCSTPGSDTSPRVYALGALMALALLRRRMKTGGARRG